MVEKELILGKLLVLNIMSKENTSKETRSRALAFPVRSMEVKAASII
jgi:hypothetical protein